jgi:tRNA1Val (adenine37-N6)-methyltransferase
VTDFHFQQFSIRQKNSAMKVGTDGVLLGAWATIPKQATRVLDIGTGTGLISLMLAQRYRSIKLDAVEIDVQAAKEAQYNFSQSPWANRCKVHAVSLESFLATRPLVYESIVSNPPFFEKGPFIEDTARNQARNAFFLSFDSLFQAAACLLNDFGIMSIIIPLNRLGEALDKAEKNKMFPSKKTLVRGCKTAAYKRVLVEFSFQKKEIHQNTLTLEISRNQRTKAHQQLVEEFYLQRH